MAVTTLLLLALHSTAASYATLHRPPTALRRAVHAVMEADASFSKEILDDAKNEEEEEFNKQMDADAAVARSADTIATLRSAGEAALAALQGAAKPEVAAALEAKGKSKHGDKGMLRIREEPGENNYGGGDTIQQTTIGQKGSSRSNVSKHDSEAVSRKERHLQALMVHKQKLAAD